MSVAPARAGAGISAIRPHPVRGDVIAAGALPLAVASIVIELRMTQWTLGPRFVVVALISCGVLALGWMSQLEGEVPRPYHTILLVAGLLPLIVALQLFAEVLGSHRPPGAGASFWTFGLEAVVAVACARRANSGACTLIAALAGAVAAEEFVSWVFHPHGIGTFRAILLVVTLAFAAGAIALRERRRRHAVQLVNAAGIVALVLALTFLATTFVALAQSRLGEQSTPLLGLPGAASFGWKLYVLAVGFGLIAYAAVDRERGPAYIGTAVLLTFAVLVGVSLSGRGSLVGWPLFLLVIGVAGLVVGMRPMRPLPPEPATVAGGSVPPDSPGADPPGAPPT